MGELAQTPQAQRSAAADALKKREDGFRAKGAQEGRAAEKAELIKRFGQAVFDQVSLLETMKAEMRAQFEREEAKHGKAAYWRGFAIGGMVCGAVVGTALALYAAAIINPAFDAAGRIRAQSDITEALVRSQQGDGGSEGYTNPGQDVTRRP